MNNKVKSAVILVIFCLMSCTAPDEHEYSKGKSELEAKNFKSALLHFENCIKYSPSSEWAIRAARDAARASQYLIKNYEKSLLFHRHLVLYSNDPEERIKSQKEIAFINFDNVQNYRQAVIEFYKLLQMTQKESEIATYKLSIARAYYYLNNFEQALSEINEVSRLKIPDATQFDLLILNGSVFVAQKEFAKAISVYNELLKKFPELSKKENVRLTLAVCFEENNQFKEAIENLEKIKDSYKPAEYIELRIKRLKERLKNQPGAKGLHRK